MVFLLRPEFDPGLQFANKGGAKANFPGFLGPLPDSFCVVLSLPRKAAHATSYSQLFWTCPGLSCTSVVGRGVGGEERGYSPAVRSPQGGA